MKQITNQQKKELFEVLIPYFESKPEDKWTIHMRSNRDGQHCAIGFLDEDFPKNTQGANEKDVTLVLGYALCNVPSLYGGLGLTEANDGITYRHLPTPKQRVLAYLNDQVKSL